MLKKEELREIRTEFWSEFDAFNKKKRTVANRKISWAQYKSGIKNIYFRLDFDTNEAYFAIDLQMRDPEIRELVWEQFMETENLLLTHIGPEMEKLPNHTTKEGLQIHRLQWTIRDVSIMNKEDYPKAIRFLSEKIQGLDAFWYEFSDLFVALCR
jgi:hypothetical protein